MNFIDHDATIQLQIPLLPHTQCQRCHPGINKTYNLLKAKNWWPCTISDINRYLSSWVCAWTKVPRTLPAGKFMPLPTPQHPWTHIALDFLTDLPETQGNTTILVISDWFSHFLHLIPLVIVSDQGGSIYIKGVEIFIEKLGVAISFTSDYHPEINGQVEQVNQEIGCFLRMFCGNNQADWTCFLPWAEYAQNSLRYSAACLTPYQYVLGFQPPLFPWNASMTDSPAVDDWFRRSEHAPALRAGSQPKQ